jgi:hypothetical protein
MGNIGICNEQRAHLVLPREVGTTNHHTDPFTDKPTNIICPSFEIIFNLILRIFFFLVMGTEFLSEELLAALSNITSELDITIYKERQYFGLKGELLLCSNHFVSNVYRQMEEFALKLHLDKLKIQFPLIVIMHKHGFRREMQHCSIKLYEAQASRLQLV